MCCNLVTYLDILRRMSLAIFTYDLLTVWSLEDYFPLTPPLENGLVLEVLKLP
jgi:hypothetical protein